MNGIDDGDNNEEAGKLGNFYAYKNTFNEETMWVDVPKAITFFNISNPYESGTSPEPESPMSSPPAMPQHQEVSRADRLPLGFEDAPGLEALSAAATSNLGNMHDVGNCGRDFVNINGIPRLVQSYIPF